MRKIIFCLLFFNVLFFTFSTSFVNADGIVNLNSFKECPSDPNPGSDRLWRYVLGSTDCKAGSYYYTKDVPPAGNLIYSSVYSDFRSLSYIYFNGTGTIDILDKDNNLIKTLNVSTQERVKLYVGNLKGFKFKYTGIDLLGVSFSWNRTGLNICYAKEGFTDSNYKFYTSKNSVNLKDIEQQQQPEQESKPECDICSKIDSIFQELKKGNDCDVCSKLSGILEDTNKINNNISQLKIITGYINSHILEIKDKIFDNSLILAKMRQTLDTMRMQDLDRNDSLDSIDNKLDNLESIDNNLVSFKDEFSDFIDNYNKNNDFSDFDFPDFDSGNLDFPDFDSGDLEKKAPELSNNFEPLDFDEDSDLNNFNSIPEAGDWTTVDGQTVKPYGAIKPDNIIKPDGVITPDSVIKPDNIIKPDGVITPDSVIKPDGAIKSDG